MELQSIESKKQSDETDNNNNILESSPVINSKVIRKKFVERRLFVADKEFLIRPNGGTGDCMFKAVCQAIHGNELNHFEIRNKVVDFIITKLWDKLQESIEIQHIHGNVNLQEGWAFDPIKTYKKYMTNNGTLGSSSELHAAGELFQYNFATIQEYSYSDKTSYRIENCCRFDNPTTPFHYFYFTGDFDNGHWEYLETTTPILPIRSSIPDGLYPGQVKVFIDGAEISLENWLKIHTDNTNDLFRLKHSVMRCAAKKSPYPFEWSEFQYQSNGTVLLNWLPFRISRSRSRRVDLFSVLTYIMLPDIDPLDESLVDKLEDQILNYRLANISSLNYKLITQPHSHGFDLTNLKYAAMPSKGNVHDLLSAADLFSFSFQIFLKTGRNQPERWCRFVHVDRWGGETDKMEYFFMRLVNGNGPQDEVYAKWWHLSPVGNSRVDCLKSAHSLIGDCPSVPDERTMCNLQLRDSCKISNHGGLDNNPSFTVIHRTNGGSNLASDLNRRQGESGESGESNSEGDYLESASEESEESYHFDPNARGTFEHSGNENPHNPETAFGESNSANGIKEMPKQLKTVVEVYDGESRRKKYVYEGFIPREEVLEALYRKGYIKNASQCKAIEKEWGSKYLIDNNESYRKEKLRRKKYSQILKDENCNKISNVEVHEVKANQASCELRAKQMSVSATALVDCESIENNSKFLHLHKKVAPYAKQQENNDCIQGFISWVCSFFSKAEDNN